ncbi:helix-turn-helix domain-containing protein [Lentzea indica]|uniref:helix-turn-helix domain-containing protein n=1 Tax=Lentzea indica TaxID=2604800 RepID=UPI001CB7209F|nr:helix-turn-helix transcriptional regulator [Lentzea indica]
MRVALLVDRAKTELLTAGGRLRDVSKSGLESLTAAEYRVATIAAYSEKSTKQIAEQLYVTRRTVEIHLANASRKLGVRDRRELRAALPRKAVPA